MNAQHTPGPWVAKESVIKVGESPIAFTAIPRKANEERMPGESWLDMRERTDPERAEIAHEELANASLIAAAPELLEALVDVMFRHVPFSDKAEYAEKARAAIAKATGGGV